MNDMVEFNEERHNEISLTLSNKNFVDMVLNFLGKKEKLTYVIKDIYFILRLNDIEQFYYLLNKKISKEQYVYIDHFLVVIYYNDNTIREISGIKALNEFIETRDVIPTDILMSWNIIIKYPDAETIENQKIELAFIRNKEEYNSKIVLNIQHTNQAWGIEVLNLFKDKLSEVANKQSKKYRIISSLINSYGAKIIGLLLYCILIYITLLSATINTYKNSDDYHKIASYYIHNQEESEKNMVLFSIEHLNSRNLRESANDITNPEIRKVLLDIADYRDNSFKKAIVLIVCVLISPIIMYILMYFYCAKALSFYKKKSFILISRRSESEHDKYISDKSSIQFYSITYILIAVLCSILASFVYQLITVFT